MKDQNGKPLQNAKVILTGTENSDTEYTDSTGTSESLPWAANGPLEKLTLPDGLQRIKSNWNLGECKSVRIPDSVTVIDDGGCSGGSDRISFQVTSFELPEGLNYLGEGAFRNCGALTSVNLPDGLTVLEQGTFGNCVSLKEIELPPNITTIGKWCFAGSGLEHITLPDSVKKVGDRAFEYCGNLRSVTLPKTKIEFHYDGYDKVFQICPNLTDFYYPGTRAEFAETYHATDQTLHSSYMCMSIFRCDNTNAVLHCT